MRHQVGSFRGSLYTRYDVWQVLEDETARKGGDFLVQGMQVMALASSDVDEEDVVR